MDKELTSKQEDVEESEEIEDTEESEEEIEEPDDILEQAQSEFRQRLEAMGGKFDSENNFIGFEETNTPVQNQIPTQQSQSEQVPPTNQVDTNKIRQDVLRDIKPAVVSSLINGILEEKPSLKRYKTIVENAIDRGTFDQINKSVVESLFYWARGQGADVEIAEATKNIRSKDKLDAGGEINSEKSTAGKPSKTIKIDEKVSEYADAWGIDPKVMASKLKDLKEKKL